MFVSFRNYMVSNATVQLHNYLSTLNLHSHPVPYRFINLNATGFGHSTSQDPNLMSQPLEANSFALDPSFPDVQEPPARLLPHTWVDRFEATERPNQAFLR